jgi:putative kinase
VLTLVLTDLINSVLGDNSENETERCAVLSMDAYHHYNTFLDAHGIRAFKGAPHTFDVAKFGRDIVRLKREPDDLLIPVYDRGIHDPRENAIRVRSGQDIVLTEGLYLCLEDSDVLDTKEKTGQNEEKGASYSSLRSLFNCTLFLPVPEVEARRRVIERKVKTGRTEEEAEAHWARSDAANWALVSSSGEQRADAVLNMDPERFVPQSLKII